MKMKMTQCIQNMFEEEHFMHNDYFLIYYKATLLYKNTIKISRKNGTKWSKKVDGLVDGQLIFDGDAKVIQQVWCS